MILRLILLDLELFDPAFPSAPFASPSSVASVAALWGRDPDRALTVYLVRCARRHCINIIVYCNASLSINQSHHFNYIFIYMTLFDCFILSCKLYLISYLTVSDLCLY